MDAVSESQSSTEGLKHDFTVGDSDVTDAGPASSNTLASLMLKLYLAVGSFGIAGNVTVLLLLTFSRRLKKNLPNQFIAIQSAIDTIVGALLISTTLYHPRLPTGLLGELVCRIWLNNAILWGFIFLSLYNMLSMTIERYVAVVHPVWHSVNVTKKGAAVCSSIYLSVVFAIAMVHSLVTTAVKDGRCSMYSEVAGEVAASVLTIWVITIELFLPVGVMLVCYGGMWWELRGAQLQHSSSASASAATGARDENVAKAQMNVLRTILLVNIVYVLSTVLNVSLVITDFFFQGVDLSGITYNTSVILVFFNSSVNPFLYCLSYRHFQLALKDVFCCNYIRNATSSPAQHAQGTTVHVRGSNHLKENDRN